MQKIEHNSMTNDKQRERLVELLEQAHHTNINLLDFEKKLVADHLLANDVVVPPCKIGDIVWYINKHPHISLFKNSVYKAEVVRIVTTALGTSLVIQIKSEGCCEIPNITDWGKTVFLTREEAEQALKGGAE